jgi:hypothetical protein
VTVDDAQCPQQVAVTNTRASFCCLLTCHTCGVPTAQGFTKVGFWPYAGASWAGMLPGTFTYVYLGSVGKAAVDAAGGGGQDGGLGAAKVALYGGCRCVEVGAECMR